ncbi:MAG TPA: haloacid dehalogenase [Candidatus Latescibacteria bacterium]|nr:haloacid dehalogenase [Candidatus Latescibacterota bacterium]
MRRGDFQTVLFDFDGTISLIRQGWREIMIPMMVEIIADIGTDESTDELSEKVADFVDLLTGQQTIYQILRLCEEVRQRGGRPRDPLVYKTLYHDRLLTHIDDRISKLESGEAQPHEWMVTGIVDLLQNLQGLGLQLVLASGTDIQYVKREAELLGVTSFFGDSIFGALDEYKDFSKAMVIQNILKRRQIRGESLLGFGDGYVEIENVKSVGGTAVGVASDEERREGVDAWKRDRLLQAGADIIIPEYTEQASLVSFLIDASAA